MAFVEMSPPEVARRAETAKGDERRAEGGWSVSEYVSHMADNLRNWAERVQGARLGDVLEIAGYDPDDLAQVRSYDAIPIEAAAWSYDIVCQAWVPVMRAALAEQVTLVHASRGQQRAEDIARNNCHDVSHHLRDIDRILAMR